MTNDPRQFTSYDPRIVGAVRSSAVAPAGSTLASTLAVALVSPDTGWVVIFDLFSRLNQGPGIDLSPLAPTAVAPDDYGSLWVTTKQGWLLRLRVAPDFTLSEEGRAYIGSGETAWVVAGRSAAIEGEHVKQDVPAEPSGTLVNETYSIHVGVLQSDQLVFASGDHGQVIAFNAQLPGMVETYRIASVLPQCIEAAFHASAGHLYVIGTDGYGAVIHVDPNNTFQVASRFAIPNCVGPVEASVFEDKLYITVERRNRTIVMSLADPENPVVIEDRLFADQDRFVNPVRGVINDPPYDTYRRFGSIPFLSRSDYGTRRFSYKNDQTPSQEITYRHHIVGDDTGTIRPRVRSSSADNYSFTTRGSTSLSDGYVPDDNVVIDPEAIILVANKAASPTRIYRSTDMGLSWSQVYQFPSGVSVRQYSLERLGDRILFAPGEFSPYLSRLEFSRDLGQTWSFTNVRSYLDPSPTAYASVRGRCAANDYAYFACDAVYGSAYTFLMRTKDFIVFEYLTGPQVVGLTLWSVLLSFPRPGLPDRIVAIGTKGSAEWWVSRSDDNGATWSTPAQLPASGQGYVTGGSPLAARVAESAPAGQRRFVSPDGLIGVVGGSGTATMAASIDGGTTWGLYPVSYIEQRSSNYGNITGDRFSGGHIMWFRAFSPQVWQGGPDPRPMLLLVNATAGTVKLMCGQTWPAWVVGQQITLPAPFGVTRTITSVAGSIANVGAFVAVTDPVVTENLILLGVAVTDGTNSFGLSTWVARETSSYFEVYGVGVFQERVTIPGTVLNEFPIAIHGKLGAVSYTMPLVAAANRDTGSFDTVAIVPGNPAGPEFYQLVRYALTSGALKTLDYRFPGAPGVLYKLKLRIRGRLEGKYYNDDGSDLVVASPAYPGQLPQSVRKRCVRWGDNTDPGGSIDTHNIQIIDGGSGISDPAFVGGKWWIAAREGNGSDSWRHPSVNPLVRNPYSTYMVKLDETIDIVMRGQDIIRLVLDYKDVLSTAPDLLTNWPVNVEMMPPDDDPNHRLVFPWAPLDPTATYPRDTFCQVDILAAERYDA